MSYPDFDPYWPDHEPYPDHDPSPDRTAVPYVDQDCRVLLDQVIDSLVILRGGSCLDPGAQLSTIASIQQDIQRRIPLAVIVARTHHGYPWNTIADRLGITPLAARSRHHDRPPHRQ